MRSLEVIIIGEGGEPALDAGSGTYPCVMKAIEAHRERLEPLLDEITHDVVEVTAKIGLREGGQVSHRPEILTLGGRSQS